MKIYLKFIRNSFNYYFSFILTLLNINNNLNKFRINKLIKLNFFAINLII